MLFAGGVAFAAMNVVLDSQLSSCSTPPADYTSEDRVRNEASITHE